MIIEKVDGLKKDLLLMQDELFKSFKTNYVLSIIKDGKSLLNEKDILVYMKKNDLPSSNDGLEDIKKELYCLFENIYLVRNKYLNVAKIKIKEIDYIQYPISRDKGVPISNDENIFESIFKKFRLKKEINKYISDEKIRENYEECKVFLNKYFSEDNNYLNIVFLSRMINNIDVNLKRELREGTPSVNENAYTSYWRSYSIPINIKVGVIRFLEKISNIIEADSNKTFKKLFNEIDVDNIKSKSFQIIYDYIINSIPLGRVHTPAPEKKEDLINFTLSLFPSESKEKITREFQEFFIEKYDIKEVVNEKLEKNKLKLKK